MRRMLLLRHASTTSVRRGAFPVDEAVDSAGLAAATGLAGRLGEGEALCGPSRRARATASAAGLAARVDPGLAECDFGAWAGRTLAEVWARDPLAAEAWMTDPDAASHGGESLSTFLARVGAWLEAQAAREGRAIAVTHGGVVKAAVVHALGAPAGRVLARRRGAAARHRVARARRTLDGHPGQRAGRGGGPRRTRGGRGGGARGGARVSAAAILGGYAADLALGDPRRRHPVAAFGVLAAALERRMHRPSRTAGALYTALLVGGAALAGRVLGRRTVALAVALWAALGGRSLAREARGVAGLVADGDLPAARGAVTALVGRDPSGLDGPELCRAAVESVAENTVDAVVAPLLWGAVAGPAGVLAHRAANTLDAMVGHRTERFERFGWASARLDDALNWPAARVTALATAALAPVAGGSPGATWRVVRRDGAAHPSPNGGRAEAAFAGALGVRLGGRNVYGARVEERPALGDGARPGPDDVERAVRLSLAVGAACALVAAGVRGVAAGMRRPGVRGAVIG